MKPVRFLTALVVLLGMTGMAFALTPANTTISNTAYGTYADANGNTVAGVGSEVASNTVTTTVAQVGGVNVSPATDGLTIDPMAVAQYGVAVTNTGNGSDTYNLTYALSGTYSGAYTVELWADLNGDGSINGGDTKLTDQGGGVYVTSALAMDSTYNLVVRVENTDLAPDGDAPVVTLTAESQFDTGQTDSGVYTTTINAAGLSVSVTTDNPSPLPGETITYTVCVDNATGAATAYNVVFSNVIPTNTTYVTNSILLGSTPQTDSNDENGNSVYFPADTAEDAGDFGGTAANTVTVFLGDIAAGAQVCVSFTVQVDANVPVNTVIDVNPAVDSENNAGTPYPTEYAPQGTGGGDIAVGQAYAVSMTTTDSVSYTGDPSDADTLTFTVTNDGNGPDDFDLSSATSTTGWTFYIDANSNGLPDAGEEVINSGSLAQGGSVDVIAVFTIPAGTADQTVDNVTLTATSANDPAGTPASDSLAITVTVTAPSLHLFKTVSDNDETDVTSNTAAPGTTLTYTVVVQNWGTGAATSITITDAVPTNTTYVTSSAAGGDTASEAGGTVTWTIATLAGDSNTGDSVYPEATLTFQVTVD